MRISLSRLLIFWNLFKVMLVSWCPLKQRDTKMDLASQVLSICCRCCCYWCWHELWRVSRTAPSPLTASGSPPQTKPLLHSAAFACWMNREATLLRLLSDSAILFTCAHIHDTQKRHKHEVKLNNFQRPCCPDNSQDVEILSMHDRNRWRNHKERQK